MCPPEQQPKDQSINVKSDTTVSYTPDGAPVVICKSKKAFVNPTLPQDVLTPEEINSQLNLNLGQTLITRENKILLWAISFLDRALIQWWEHLFFYVWSEVVPLSCRRFLAHRGWQFYYKLHKAILGKRTGLHVNQSYEYHAITTIIWAARLIAVTPRRMRFSLSQLYVIAPNEPPSKERIQHISEQPSFLTSDNIPTEQETSCVVNGMYIHQHVNQKTEKAIFWLYGGAFLAGDIRGNASTADWMSSQCNLDVFIPKIRLAPEANIDDVLWDVCLAYKWFSQKFNDPSKQILVLGISSGGALATRLMQLIAQFSRDETIGVPSYFDILLDGTSMPSGGILFAPYVDYERESKGSFLHYPKHDLIVTESVQENGLPYLDDFIPLHEGMEDPRKEYSPIHITMLGLPPLCVVVSEHEAVYDMTVKLVNRGRSEGVQVTLYMFKYMCHVFSFLNAFVPEGQLSLDMVVCWINNHNASKQ